MKKLSIIILTFLPLLLIGQGNWEHRDTKYQSTYTPLPLDLMQKRLDEMQNAYDNNKAYIDQLVDWTFDLKKQANDKAFTQTMDYYYGILKKLYGTDLAQASNQLKQIELGIKEEIEKFNKRIAEENNPQKFFDSGLIKLKSDDYNGAITDFTKLIDLDPKSSAGYFYRGYVYYMQGYYAKAIPDFSKTIEIDPDYYGTYEDRGWCYNYTSEFSLAMQDFNKFIGFEPDKYNGYFGRGYAKSNLGDYAGSNADYNKTIELEPNHSMAYNNRGWNKFEKKIFKEH